MALYLVSQTTNYFTALDPNNIALDSNNMTKQFERSPRPNADELHTFRAKLAELGDVRDYNAAFLVWTNLSSEEVHREVTSSLGLKRKQFVFPVFGFTTYVLNGQLL